MSAAAVARPAGAPLAGLGARLRTPTGASTVLAVALAIAYLVWFPQVPDLAAQTARADTAAAWIYWTGWFGGVHTPGYSVVVPPLMALLSTRVVGAVALVAAAALFPGLLRSALRPLLAGLAFTVLAWTNVLTGRLTFAVGVVLALAALRLLASGHTRWMVLPALLSGLASPVAALFLGVVAAVLVIFAPGWRTRGFVLGVAAAAPVLAIAALFPDPGRMPFTRDALKPSLFASLGLIPALYGRTARLVRWGAVFSLVMVVGAYLITSPIGSNAERLALLWALPVLLAYSPLPAFAVALIAVPLIWWPERNLRQELTRAADPSAQRAFYTPLIAELAKVWDGSRRVELVDTRTHWGSTYVAERFPLARGWERQVDSARNPIFYGRSPLTAASYRAFLDEYAVGWVAVPDAKLDFGAGGEAQLIRRGLPYLTPVWHQGAWTLYAVAQPRPLVSGDGLKPISVGRSSVTLAADTAGASGVLQLHWSRWLSTDNGTIRKAGEWTYVRAARAGRVTISAG